MIPNESNERVRASLELRSLLLLCLYPPGILKLIAAMGISLEYLKAGNEADIVTVSNENAAGEYYLTDAVAIARRRGLKCGAIECDPDELSGANTQEELAALEKYLTARNNKKGK